jgi:hypothetical protein
MTKNPHRAKLERELSALKLNSVAIRKEIESLRFGYGAGDGLDRRTRAEALTTRLQYMDREKARLRMELGLPEPTGPVKIPPAEVSRSELAAFRARRAFKRVPAPGRG